MPYTANGKTLLLDALRGGAPAANRGIATASLHTAAPGDSGASELATAGYARQAVTLSAANAELAGSIDMTNTLSFTVTGATVTHVGFWSGAATPLFLMWYALAAPEVYGGTGTFLVSDADMNVNL